MRADSKLELCYDRQLGIEIFVQHSASLPAHRPDAYLAYLLIFVAEVQNVSYIEFQLATFLTENRTKKRSRKAQPPLIL